MIRALFERLKHIFAEMQARINDTIEDESDIDVNASIVAKRISVL